MNWLPTNNWPLVRLNVPVEFKSRKPATTSELSLWVKVPFTANSPMRELFVPSALFTINPEENITIAELVSLIIRLPGVFELLTPITSGLPAPTKFMSSVLALFVGDEIIRLLTLIEAGKLIGVDD